MELNHYVIAGPVSRHEGFSAPDNRFLFLARPFMAASGRNPSLC
jgi:hypothetical protein